MADAKDLNSPEVYAEALARAALTDDVNALAAWLAGDEKVADNPFHKWYLFFAQRLEDLAPRPELGFKPRSKQIAPAPKIGRNDPCPCGSGKKFKQCHIGKEEAVAWKLAPPTRMIQSVAAAQLIHQLSTEQLDAVPTEGLSEVAATEMATVYHEAEQVEKAAPLLKEVLDGPRNDDMMLYDYWIARYAEWLVELEREKEAEEFLLDEYDAHRGVEKHQVAQKLAAFYLDLGDPDNAETWIDSAIGGEADNPFNYYLKGLMQHQTERYDEACAAYATALDMAKTAGHEEDSAMLELISDALERAKNRQPPDEEEPGEGDPSEAETVINPNPGL
ncbi:SEC-C metal-binding domain-containing protein [Magnetofaba australis]|uniref:SEC-C metal-binding domain-containing protein n=1 Tax=Magnetofaba australis TaxID=1472297 RepID=UPI0018EA0489|nr:SEC-C metal-binding domain-containing protein [Magnetofaba australis]